MATATRKITVATSLTPDILERVEELAEASRTTVCAYIRNLVVEHVEGMTPKTDRR